MNIYGPKAIYDNTDVTVSVTPPVAYPAGTPPYPSSPKVNTLGELMFVLDAAYGWLTYKWVQEANVGALTAKSVVGYTDIARTLVTSTIASTKANWVAGVANYAVTQAYQFWLQIGGYCPGIQATSTGNAGDNLIFGGNAVAAAVTAGTACTYLPLGAAQSAIANSAVACFLQVAP